MRASTCVRACACAYRDKIRRYLWAFIRVCFEEKEWRRRKRRGGGRGGGGRGERKGVTIAEEATNHCDGKDAMLAGIA